MSNKSNDTEYILVICSFVTVICTCCNLFAFTSQFYCCSKLNLIASARTSKQSIPIRKMYGKIVEVIEKYQIEQMCDIFIKRNLQRFWRYLIYFSLTASKTLQLK